MTQSGEDQLDAWTATFAERERTFEDLRIEVEKVLVDAIDAVPLKIHVPLSRVKTISSFREKIVKKRNEGEPYHDPFTEMHDIVGVRITCLFLDDLDVVDGIIRELFEDIKHDDKVKNVPHDKFGYRSVHYDCHLPTSFSGPRYDHIKTITFEIQVRTILQDAWAVVEHTLGYKGPNSIPDESKADFAALVGLFHLADKTFQQIRVKSLQQDIKAEADVTTVTAHFTAEGVVSLGGTLKIDRSTLKALLHRRYGDRELDSDSAVSELVEELAEAGIASIEDLILLLNEQNDRGLEVEADDPPIDDDNGEYGSFTAVGFVRTCVALAGLGKRRTFLGPRDPGPDDGSFWRDALAIKPPADPPD
jgi:putative GTP pyrophosphokinase